MDQIKLLNFADFFFNISKKELDDEYLINGELTEVQEIGQLQVQELIRNKQVELQFKKERKIKEEYLKLKNQITIKASEKLYTNRGTTRPHKEDIEEKTAPTEEELIKLLKLTRQPEHQN